jgi:hypothetical protein
MKHLKMLVLAAIAAMGLMAFLGAGSASATVLCTTTDTPDCSAAWDYPAKTVIDSSLTGTAILESGSTTLDTCTGGTVKGETSTTGSSTKPVTGGISQLTWAGCTNTTDTLTGGSLEVNWIEGTHNGTVSGSGSEVTVNTLGVSCVYGTGAGTHLGTLTGGSEPVLKISTTVPKISGSFICPSKASWTAEYVLTEPHALFVTTGAS